MIASCLTHSPIVLVFYLKEEQVNAFDQYLEKAQGDVCSSRIRFVTYVASKGSFFYSNYPINILRNLGIAHVRTSHFICLDMDMWMSCKKSLRLLSRSILWNTLEAPGLHHIIHPNGRGDSCLLPHRMEDCKRNNGRTSGVCAIAHPVHNEWIAIVHPFKAMCVVEERVIHPCLREWDDSWLALCSAKVGSW